MFFPCFFYNPNMDSREEYDKRRAELERLVASMGLDYIELGKQTGRMAAKVLKGEAKASEMNFEVIEEASFYGNTAVAENLGITLPEDLTANAAELFTEIAQ